MVDKINDKKSPEGGRKEEYRYKTCHLASSPKKLKALSKQMHNLTLPKAIDLASFSTKGFSKVLTKSLMSIRSNLVSVRNVQELDVDKFVIGKVVIEKTFRTYGHRIKARGHAASSKKDFCTLNLYIRSN